MSTQNLIRLLLRDDLDEALAIQVSLGSRVCRKAEFSNIVLNSGGFELLLGLAHPRNLRVSVDDRRNSVVVDVAVSALEVFDSGDTYKTMMS